MEILLGALVSGLTQWIKSNAFFSTPWRVIALTLTLSIIGAAVYQYLVYINYWQSVLATFMVASTIYAVLIKPLES